MNRLEVNPSLRDALAAAGVRTAEDLLAWAQPADAHSLGVEIRRPVEGTSGHFYCKAYRYPGWRKSKGLVSRGTLWGSAPCIREFRNLRWLRERDVPAVRPIAAAAVVRRRRLVAHALVTERIEQAEPLSRLLSLPDADLEPALVELGRIVGRMHAQRFVHRDLYARNVVVPCEFRFDLACPAQPTSVFLLDCRRGGRPSLRKGTAFDLATLREDLDGSAQWKAFERGYAAPA